MIPSKGVYRVRLRRFEGTCSVRRVGDTWLERPFRAMFGKHRNLRSLFLNAFAHIRELLNNAVGAGRRCMGSGGQRRARTTPLPVSRRSARRNAQGRAVEGSLVRFQ